MEKTTGYSINELSRLSGLTPRTLRYYHEIGLLQPAEVRPSGYRYYRGAEVDRLQQILFYRELGFALDEIKAILASPDFDRETALKSHLASMERQRDKMDALIRNLQKTIGTLKGEQQMRDDEKFEGFKQKMIDDNEDQYGEEVRQKYGDDVVEASNRKLKNMTKEQMDKAARLSEELNDAIGKALATKNPAGDEAMAACALHKEWLQIYWPDGYYKPEAHKGLAEMYCQDPRFRAYYEKIGPDCADFLKEAIYNFCDRKVDAAQPADTRKTPEVDQYIGQFPDEVRATLEKLRDLILANAPAATERIAYGMPTYTMKKNLIHFAGYKKHIGLYPTPDGIEAFKEELSRYKNSKGAVQFPLNQPMPWDLIERIVKYRVANQE